MSVTLVLQGGAADIVKGVMVELQEQLRQTGLEQHCHMLLQVSTSCCCGLQQSLTIPPQPQHVNA